MVLLDWELTSMDHVALVQVVDGVEDLADGLGRVFFGELALFADAVEELAARGQLRDNVPFILVHQRRIEMSGGEEDTLDSNHSWNLTICGWCMRDSIDISSYTIDSLPLTLFFRMILMAHLPCGPSASRTIP